MADKTLEYFVDIQALSDLTEDQVPPELWEAHRYMTESMGAITMSSFNMGDAADAAADRDKDTFVSKLQESQTAAKDCVKYWDVFISKMKEATGMSEDELAQIGITKDTMKPVTGE